MSVVKYTIQDHVAYITLNRPEKLNAITREMTEKLYQAFSDVRENDEVWAAIITGEGRSFSTGHDLQEVADIAPGTPGSTTALYQCIQEIWKPTIAAINGFCLAQGAGIALSCDIRIASERAQFGWPQVKRGIASTSGPCILAHHLPLNIALELLYTGDLIDAQEAKRLNLVNKVVPHERLRDESEQFVRQILQNAPLAMRAIKEIAIRSIDMTMEDRIRFAGLLSAQIQESEDAKEGLSAFREKRQPVWQGR
ncbi:MAG: enoyl-CoA hydratase/isomerase family protein [Nitrospinota bacterium]|nr:MAG: enoyl-CoA hydratase/isomerase family protein [Nitrospinota bacterium]